MSGTAAESVSKESAIKRTKTRRSGAARRRRRLALGALGATVVAASTYALAAANAVPASKAGYGANSILPYTESSVAYTLNATDPNLIDQVSFTLSPTAASSVKVRLPGAGPWYSCANSGGSVTCATTSPQATVSGANGSTLTVVAVQ